jgi:hypothetical protein
LEVSKVRLLVGQKENIEVDKKVSTLGETKVDRLDYYLDNTLVVMSEKAQVELKGLKLVDLLAY